MLQVLQVTSPAGKGKEKEFRMEMWMFTMSLRGVWRDHPGCLCVFSWHCELQTGQCSDLTRPFFADSHWEAEPYQRLFLQQTRSSFPRREVSGHVTGRLSVPNQSSFGELRMGPTLRDTLDNGLCCSSQGRGHVQSFENYSNVEVMPTTANYNLPHRTGRLS